MHDAAALHAAVAAAKVEYVVPENATGELLRHTGANLASAASPLGLKYISAPVLKHPGGYAPAAGVLYNPFIATAAA